MPGGAVKTPADEKRWSRAKEIFKEQKGRDPEGDDYALVMHIFQGMKRTKHVPGQKKKALTDLRRAVIRLAASEPQESPLRKALLASMYGPAPTERVSRPKEVRNPRPLRYHRSNRDFVEIKKAVEGSIVFYQEEDPRFSSSRPDPEFDYLMVLAHYQNPRHGVHYVWEMFDLDSDSGEPIWEEEEEEDPRRWWSVQQAWKHATDSAIDTRNDPGDPPDSYFEQGSYYSF